MDYLQSIDGRHRRPNQEWRETMTANRLNAAFAATLATAFSFAFVMATMPLSALTASGALA